MPPFPPYAEPHLAQAWWEWLASQPKVMFPNLRRFSCVVGDVSFANNFFDFASQRATIEVLRLTLPFSVQEEDANLVSKCMDRPLLILISVVDRRHQEAATVPA